MIAKIVHGGNIIGAIPTTNSKWNRKKGDILDTHRILQAPDGSYLHVEFFIELLVKRKKKVAKGML